MKVYLASMYATKERMKQYAAELRREGIGVTSRWLKEPSKPEITLAEAKKELGEDEMIAIARHDLADIYEADLCLLFTVEGTTPTVRGGRHFESGYAYALYQLLDDDSHYRHQLVTIGPKENIFHFLPEVLNFPTWEEAKKWLIAQRDLHENGCACKQHQYD